jgi:hypothetical protein
LPLLLLSSSRISQPSESCAGRIEHSLNCVFFISRNWSITSCFCSLGRTSMPFCTGSGRWRVIASGLVAVANSSSAACGVVPCHANKGTADNSAAKSQRLLIEHLRENQTPDRRQQFPLLLRTRTGDNLARNHWSAPRCGKNSKRGHKRKVEKSAHENNNRY